PPGGDPMVRVARADSESRLFRGFALRRSARRHGYTETPQSDGNSTAPMPINSVTPGLGGGRAVMLAAVCAVLTVAWLPIFAARIWSRPAQKQAGELVLSVSPPWQATAAYDRSWIPDLHPDEETR